MSEELKGIVLKKIEEKGKITFAEFMDIALYYPGLGYYQKENPFGTTGSFYTSVNASETFGFSIARSILNIIKQFNLPSNLCEMGAGSGMLSNDILNYYRDNEPDFYKDVKYTIIEKSSYLINRQKQLLHNHKEKVNWVEFDKFDDFEGVFFSNELVDAFPVHRIININGEYKEIYVAYIDGRLQFFPDKFSTIEIEEYLKRLRIRLVDKQIADINLDAIRWIQSLGRKIKKGVIITIDYGWTADKLYAPFRMDGTVTCYFNHKQNNDFFERIGDQDITAFVDFSTLMEYGKDVGLDVVNLIPQSLYLVQSGILQFISKASTDLQKASIKSLFIPEGGFGTNFHVLIQSKNLTIGNDFIHKKSPTETYIKLASEYEKLNIENL
jgi:SAM-dependent MidA family methyltransferase